MLTSPDFKELLSLFQRHEVRYLVIGGYAVMKYSEPRFTKDLNLLIGIDRKNSEAVFASLKEFGAPLKGLSIDDFSDAEYFYQMGKEPMRLDVMMGIPGVDFEEAWNRREEVILKNLKIFFISKEDLIRSKKAAGRPQDLLDLEKLKQI